MSQFYACSDIGFGEMKDDDVEDGNFPSFSHLFFDDVAQITKRSGGENLSRKLAKA